MTGEQVKDDVVNRDGIDYLTGWFEALVGVVSLLEVEKLRRRVGETAGLNRSTKIAAKMYGAARDKLQSRGTVPQI